LNPKEFGVCGHLQELDFTQGQIPKGFIAKIKFPIMLKICQNRRIFRTKSVDFVRVFE
jgi:hypothetical protein